ncbi:MAG: hypothetical protein AABW46_00525 [Nanoarchaeota archaeon]
MNKKAQIEIMGLMVIVLILIFIIIVSLRFLVSPKSDTDELQRQSIQASNMLNAIIRSNTPGGSKVTNKIVECYNANNIDSDPCTFMRENFQQDILNEVFKTKKYRLEFIATNPYPKNYYGIQNCDPNQATITGSATVSVSPRILAKIILCIQPQQSISS